MSDQRLRDSVPSIRAKEEMPGHTPHSPHLEKSAERILRVSFLLGTHRSLRGYCWRGGERKRQTERTRERPGRGSACRSWDPIGPLPEGCSGFSFPGPSPQQCSTLGEQRHFGGFSFLVGKLLQQNPLLCFLLTRLLFRHPSLWLGSQ